MAADELRRAVHDDVRAVLERAQEIRRRERAVHDKRNVVLVRDGRDGLDVDEVRVRITDGLDVDDARVLLDRVLEDLRALRRIDERRLDAVIRERVLEEVVRAAVDGRRRDDVLAAVDERLDGVGNSRRAGGDSDRRDAALERRDAAGEDVLRRVREASVDVARVLQREAIRRVLSIVENVTRRLVDGDGARVRRGIGLLLADVELQGLKMVFLLFTHRASSSVLGSVRLS